MRVIIPPLTSQYLNLIKNSSLAVAIGYPDLVQVFAGTVLNITGQAVEVIAITMAVYLVHQPVRVAADESVRPHHRRSWSADGDGGSRATSRSLRAARRRKRCRRRSARTGAFGWLRANLFSSPANIALTLLCVAADRLGRAAAGALLSHRCGLVRRRPRGLPRHARAPRSVGACWAFVRVWFSYFVYGFYPVGQRWRVDLFFVALAFGIVWLLRLSAPRRDLGALYFFVVLPILSFVLLHGAPPIGLAVVPTSLWGGMLVTIVVATVGIVFSLPLGILLALGRRSELPVVRLLSVTFIEFVRGVPLITVLFMASVMLPLFVPERSGAGQAGARA